MKKDYDGNLREVSRPLIGLTACAPNDQDRFHSPAVYCEAIVRAGGLPVLLPPVPVQVAGWLMRLDGLILTGGEDIDPAFYGGRLPVSNDANLLRDLNERALVDAALELRLPTLAICRGMQMLNVALGGTLIPHIADECGEQVVHRRPPRQPAPHAVTLEPDSQLAKILDCTECTPLSSHHQAIRQLGRGLRVVARAADGIIEAVELPEAPWLVAVQWHPELSVPSEPRQQKLFEHLVQAAAQAGSWALPRP